MIKSFNFKSIDATTTFQITWTDKVWNHLMFINITKFQIKQSNTHDSKNIILKNEQMGPCMDLGRKRVDSDPNPDPWGPKIGEFKPLKLGSSHI